MPIPDGVRAVAIGGDTVHYLERGRGDPLVLIHGSMSDYRSFALQMEAFAGAYRTISVSLPHSYPEAWDGKAEYTVGRHAEDVARFIAAQRLAPAHVVGHSRGGAVAMVLALHHPDLVRSLVLAEPAGLEGLLPPTPEGRKMAEESAAMFARLGRDLAAGDKQTAARNFVDALGGPGAWDRRAPEARQITLDNITTGPACAERPYFTPAEIARIACPTLLVTGERSPPRYNLTMTTMQEHNPKILPLKTLPNAAHAMQRDNPAAFNAAVLEFLASR